MSKDQIKKIKSFRKKMIKLGKIKNHLIYTIILIFMKIIFSFQK